MSYCGSDGGYIRYVVVIFEVYYEFKLIMSLSEGAEAIWPLYLWSALFRRCQYVQRC